jgi:tRNA-specific adenosine deaminase 3
MLFEEVIDIDPVPADEKYISVVVAEIPPPRASALLQLLSDKLPLERFNLEHLKRIRRIDSIPPESGAIVNEEGKKGNFSLEILLCPEKDSSLIQDIMVDYPKRCIRTVCKYYPRNRAEFEEYREVSWFPILFRPNDLDRERERGLSDEFVASTSKFMQLVEEDSLDISRVTAALGEALTDLSGAVLVDPHSGAVVMSAAVALQRKLSVHGPSLLKHALYSPTMLVIGALSAVLRLEYSPHPLTAPPLDQYLCTGLILYLHREPDMVASMALVHSRIAAVVYKVPNPDGALGSQYKLHTLRSINHRFRVYRSAVTTDTLAVEL